MSRRDGTANLGGFTLVEIAIAVAIVGILVMLAVSSFKELSEKYGIESETKQLHADLMEARGRALQRNRYHFVRFTGTGYATYEDSYASSSPDGNRAYDAGDKRVVNVTVKHPITTDLPASGGVASLDFNRHGIASATGYVRISTGPGFSVTPDYDCISIRETRINTGQFNAGTCVEK